MTTQQQQPPWQQPPQWTQPPPPSAPPRKRRSKRQILLLTIVAVVGGLWLIGTLADSDDQSSTAPNATDNGVEQGLGAKNAAADVQILKFVGKDYGESEATLEIVNHSTGTSDYYIEVAFENKAGTNVGWGNALAQHVKPGQKALATASIFDESAARVIVTKVQRTASA